MGQEVLVAIYRHILFSGGAEHFFEKIFKFSIIAGGIASNFRKFFKNFLKILRKKNQNFRLLGGGEGYPRPPLGTPLFILVCS